MRIPGSGAPFWRTLLVTVLLGYTFVSTGCDDTETVQPSEVAGEYRFTEFRFVPLSSLVVPVNLLDTLVASGTRLQLFSSSRFSLLYEFEGARQEFVGGGFNVSESEIVLKGEKEDERFYRALLLDLETRLQRQPNDTALKADLRRRVNLQEFSDRYKGLPSVDGNLKITLQRF